MSPLLYSGESGLWEGVTPSNTSSGGGGEGGREDDQDTEGGTCIYM